MSSGAPNPEDTSMNNLYQSASSITVPPSLSVTARASLDSSPFSAACKEATCGDLPDKVERCASRKTPPVQMKDELPGPRDNPLDLTAAPGGFCVPRGHMAEADSHAAFFWRRCNEVGYTETIFTELTRQLSSLAEKVQNQRATQQGENALYLLYIWIKVMLSTIPAEVSVTSVTVTPQTTLSLSGYWRHQGSSQE